MLQLRVLRAVLKEIRPVQGCLTVKSPRLKVLKLSQALTSISMQYLVSQGACPSPEHHAFDGTAPPQNRHFPNSQSSGRPTCAKLDAQLK